MGNRAAALAMVIVLVLAGVPASRALSRPRACVTLGVGSIRFGRDGSTASFEAVHYLRARPPSLPGAAVSVYLVDYPTDAAYEVSGLVDGWVSYRSHCVQARSAQDLCYELHAEVAAELMLRRWGRRVATFHIRAPPLRKTARRWARGLVSRREILAPIFAALRDRLEETMTRDRVVGAH